MTSNDLAVCARCKLCLTSPLCLVLLAACGAPPPPPAAQLHTLDALWAEAHAQVSPGADVITLAGQPLPFFSAPFQSTAATQLGPSDGLDTVPSFVEGQTATYVTSEVWDNIPVIWVQPLYILVTGFLGPDANGVAIPLRDEQGNAAPTVFGIGPKSRFYSPYWQTLYAVIPAGMSYADAAARYVSTKAILDDGLALVEGRARICSLMHPGTPLRIGIASTSVDGKNPLGVSQRPISTETAFNPTQSGVGRGVVDGEPYDVIGFGTDKFEWNADTQVVTESALFHLARRNPDNSLTRLALLPSVGGSGPLYSGAPARYSAPGKPAFSGLWHEYDVALPFNGAGNMTAAPFTLPGTPQQAAAMAQGFLRLDAASGGQLTTAWPVGVAAQALPGSVINQYLLRVALNPGDCFVDAAFPAGSCQWLDSQAAVEAALPQAFLQDAYRWSTCPVLELGGHAVPQ